MSGVDAIYQVPAKTRVTRHFLRFVFRGVFRLLYRVSLQGFENIPPSGPYLIAFNHLSIVEPPFLLTFWPQPPEAIGASDVWDRPGQALMVRLYGTIPVHRGEYDRRVIAAMLAVLGSGRPLLIAPEGGRTHTPGLRRALPGVGYLVDKAHVPVVPVGVVGSSEERLGRALRGGRPRLAMRVGPPIAFPRQIVPSENRRRVRQEIADQVMVHLARLLPDDYQGVYADRLTLATQAAQPGDPT